MALILEYYPARSRYYKRIWARVKSGVHNQVRFLTFDRKQYQSDYNKRSEIKQARTDRNLETKLLLFSYLGGKCVKCGYDDHRALQLDHIKGNGSKTRKESGLHKNRIKYYNYLLQNPSYTLEEIQLLCANCNWVKRYENNEGVLK